VPDAEKENFYAIAQDEVKRRLKYKIFTEKREIEVFVLKKISEDDILKASLLVPKISYSSSENRNRLSAEGQSITELNTFLDDKLSKLVIDETDLNQKYDFVIDWKIGNHAELLEELKKVGLTLEKANRSVEMLIIADK
jgi:uncharacterized protein (TIGR03435 family)